MSDSDSDLETYSNIAKNFQALIKKNTEQRPSSPTKKTEYKLLSAESPYKTDADKPENLSDSDTELPEKSSDPAENGVSESVEINDEDSNLSASNLEDSILVEDSPVSIVEDDELDDCGPVSRRTRRQRKRTCGTKKKQSPSKKKTIEANINLLDDDDDSFRLSQEQTIEEDFNPEIEVKVHWRLKQLERVTLRKFQKIEAIFEKFAELEGVPITRISLSLYDKILKPTDTPESLGLKITDFLEGGVLSETASAATVTETRPERIDKDSIALKVMREDVREPLTVRVKKSEKMRIFIIKVGEALKLKEGTFKIYFDGDQVEPDDTPESLDLEGDERFDLKIF